jgi:hypothetical protein
MSRTRTIFFIFLAVYLAFILAALALGIVSTNFVRLIFIASTVFSVGVVLLDFFGVLGGDHSGETSGDMTAGGDHSATDLDGADGDAGLVAAHSDADHAAGDHAAQMQHGPEQPGAGPILSALVY